MAAADQISLPNNRFAAAAGTAWYSRQKIVDTAQNSQLWVTSHLEFVGVLWKTSDLRERLEELLDLEENNVQFFWYVPEVLRESEASITDRVALCLR